MNTPTRIAIIGMGGFAQMHHQSVRALEEQGVCRLICTCDPDPAAFAELRGNLDFAGRGVQVFDDYLAMLDACGDALDVVTIPTPIPLHAPMHKACVERGLAVYLEKPPTLDVAELQAMLAVEARTAKLTQVGFNFIIEAQRQQLKRRLVAGEFGAVRRVSVTGRWPRNRAYFTRAAWAGRLLLDGRLVLDSCMGNAMAHYVHNGLFWAGTREQWAWGEIAEVEAELYRAHPIEGTDTIFVRAHIADGPTLLLAMSHACLGDHYHAEHVECEHAEITYMAGCPDAEGRSVVVRWHDGREEYIPTYPDDLVAENLRAYCAYISGDADRPMTRLLDAQPFVELNDLAYLAAGRITTIPEHAVQHDTAWGGVAIRGLEDIFDRFLTTETFPSTQGVAWAQPGGRARREDLPKLPAVIAEMVTARQA